MRDSTEAEILAYICQVAIERDRDLMAYIIRAGIERGRGDAIVATCREHRGEEVSAAQTLAELDGVLVPIGSRQERPED